MEEIIVIKDKKLEQYKNLLLRKETLLKEAYWLNIEYNQEFGDLLIELFEAKIKCIEKKKIITYCNKLLNQGIIPKQKDIDKEISKTMKEYYVQLNELIKSAKASKKTVVISEQTYRKIKRIYYRIVRLIHPDMNVNLANDKYIKELWNRVQNAYHGNRLKELEDLEFLVNNYLQQINEKLISPKLENIDDKIIVIKKEIENIINTDPYQYKSLLEDEELVRKKKQSIEQEIEEYRKYERELDDVISTLNIERNYA